MKRFKPKKSSSHRLLLILIIMYIIYKNFNIKFTESKKEIIDYVYTNDIAYSYKNNILNNLYSYFNKYIFNTPVNILDTRMNIDKTIYASNILYVDNRPKVYIYNSHPSEGYIDPINITIKDVSNILKEKLDSLNIKTIVETNDILDYMNYNNLIYEDSYVASRYFLNQVYNAYPNLELYIDLHRDAGEYTEVINDKRYAKILFVIGLENPNYQVNLDTVTRLNEIINSKYNLSRGILKKEGVGVNGVYNQDISGNVILIEVGGNLNTIEEVTNTIEILAEVIEEYINEKEKI